jgi:hypothetical protein
MVRMAQTHDAAARLTAGWFQPTSDRGSKTAPFRNGIKTDRENSEKLDNLMPITI